MDFELSDEQENIRRLVRDFAENEVKPVAEELDREKRVIAIRGSLAEQPERLAAFERDFLAYAEHANSGPSGGPAEYRYEYLLVVARKRS